MKINKSFIVSLKASTDKQKYFWDDDLKGFGVRFQGSTKSYIVMYRNAEGKQRMLTLGRVDKLTPEEARTLAKDKLADAVKGKDPASEKTERKKQMTVAELCNWYLQEGCEHKKPYTIKQDISRIERHIKPLIGKLPVVSLTTATVEKMMIDIARGKTAVSKKGDKPRATINVTGGKGTASRAIGMFGSILEFAKRHRLIESNPARGVKRYKDNKNDVFLTIEQIKELGTLLRLLEEQGENKTAINAIKLLLLTGCRRNEILSLKWEYIDFKNKCFRFPDTKTGRQIRAFGQGALNLLSELKQQSKSEWVFPSNVNSGHLVGLPRIFRKIRVIENPETNKPYIGKDVCIHSLRHSFASLGADMGFTEFSLAGLLGHRLGSVTNRYSHNVDTSLIHTADKISLRIENALNGNLEQENKVVNLRGARV